MSSFSLNTFFNAVNYALTVSNYQDFFLRVKQYKVLEAVLSGRDSNPSNWLWKISNFPFVAVPI